MFEDLRRISSDKLIDIGFDGYAVGGLAVGAGQEKMLATLDFAVPMLPADRPRSLMGVVQPDDIVEAVCRGIDMFDCVLPTLSGLSVAHTSELQSLLPFSSSVFCFNNL